MQLISIYYDKYHNYNFATCYLAKSLFLTFEKEVCV